jgi:hypothetical protein
VEISSSQDTSLYYTISPHCLGVVIVGDTLYITAQTSIIGFDLVTDALVIYSPISGAVDLNDITADTSGFLYMTDSYGQKVFKYDMTSQTSSIILSGIYWPNGILFDEINNRLLMCSFGSNAPIRSISLDGSSVSILISTPFTNLDGLTEDNDGNIYVSTWGSGAVYRYDREFIQAPLMVSNGHNGPADIYFDRINNILVVPNFGSHTVDFIDMDIDDDGLLNLDDNCMYTYNPEQIDTDQDGVGDTCDACPGFDDTQDFDNDGVPDSCDNCPEDPNPDQSLDADLDEVGDVCDNCPLDFNPDQEDTNENGIGDVCDYVCGDANNDGSVNILDITFLIAYKYLGGAEPEYLVACDVNGSGTYENPDVNILDITHLIAYLYLSGPPLFCPLLGY